MDSTFTLGAVGLVAIIGIVWGIYKVLMAFAKWTRFGFDVYEDDDLADLEIREQRGEIPEGFLEKEKSRMESRFMGLTLILWGVVVLVIASIVVLV